MEVYAITVIGSLAGSLGAFLIKRGEELDAAARLPTAQRTPLTDRACAHNRSPRSRDGSGRVDRRRGRRRCRCRAASCHTTRVSPPASRIRTVRVGPPGSRPAREPARTRQTISMSLECPAPGGPSCSGERDRRAERLSARKLDALRFPVADAAVPSTPRNPEPVGLDHDQPVVESSSSISRPSGCRDESSEFQTAK